MAHDGMQASQHVKSPGRARVCASCGGAGIHEALKSLHLLAKSYEFGWTCCASLHW